MDHKELIQEKIDYLISLFSSGDIEKATNKVDSLLKKYPDEPLLFNFDGACKSAKGDLKGALESYKKAISIKPDYVEAFYNVAGIYHNLKQYDESIDSYKNAIALRPKYAEAYNNLGNLYLELNKNLDAIECFENATKYKVDFTEPHFNLGYVHNKLGNFNDSIEHYEKTIELHPEFAGAHNNLGKALHNKGDLHSAAFAFEQSINLASDFAEPHNNLGVVLQDLGNLEDAIQSYENSIDLMPDAKTINNLGIAYQEFGKIDDAIQNFEKAIELYPEYADSFHNLSYLKIFSENDPLISKMQLLHSKNDINASEKILVCLALAKVYENQGNHNGFFKYLNEGNELRKKELGFSIKNSLKKALAIKEIFKPDNELLDSHSTKRSDKKPIFILGMPRSGTTLVEQILSSHKEVYGAGELKTLTSLVNPLIDNFISGDIEKLSQQAISFIRNEYLDNLSNLNVSQKIITDKLPLNFQYIGFILSSFPDAKIIHLNRDPIATCWSNYRCSFTASENGYSYDFKDLADFYSIYQDLMDFWHELYPKKIYDMNYEYLTTNQEEETRLLLDYCGLEWDENCLNFHKNKRAVQTASAMQVRKKMYQGSSEDWKKYRTHIQPLIDGLKSLE